MNDTEYVPGTWKLKSTYCNCPRPCSHGLVPTYIEADDRVIVVKEDATADELRLIAAAPELLAVCEELFHFLIHELYDDRKMAQELTKILGDTIDKARGRL